MRSYADQPTISAYHGIYRAPYDFLAHPIAPCGTLVVVHDHQRATWDPYGQVGFYLGPSLNHYRSYRCLISATNSIRVHDSIILYPAPLVVPDASRLDLLLNLTQQLTTCALYPTLDSDLETKDPRRLPYTAARLPSGAQQTFPAALPKLKLSRYNNSPRTAVHTHQRQTILGHRHRSRGLVFP